MIHTVNIKANKKVAKTFDKMIALKKARNIKTLSKLKRQLKK
ncbi:hypothetical protein ACSSV5_000015 [Psychroflexus sp. MBR-150]